MPFTAQQVDFSAFSQLNSPCRARYLSTAKGQPGFIRLSGGLFVLDGKGVEEKRDEREGRRGGGGGAICLCV